jgi:Fe-S-cluster containining protein
MQPFRELRLKTNCASCAQKCCSQPYDWVYLTAREIARIGKATGLPENAFVLTRQNANTGHVFRTLNLPCRFLNAATGECNVYDMRPLVCRLFPFYPEPLTGHAALIPVQCGPNLEFLAPNSNEGWSLADFESETRRWLAELWSEAGIQRVIARADGSP